MFMQSVTKHMSGYRARAESSVSGLRLGLGVKRCVLGLGLAIGLVTGLVLSESPAMAAAPSQGAVFISGGALKYDNQEVWKRIVDEAGGPGARFAVFATAAANPSAARLRSLRP